MLQVGQVIRIIDALYRVDLVNPSRARVVPLSKRHVTLGDHEFEAEGRGFNISPNSVVEVVENVERMRDELELAAAERELRRARHQAQAEERKTVVPPLPASPPARANVVGWHRGAAPVPALKVGSLAAQTLALVVQHPGLSTKALSLMLPTASAGAVAACLDRFSKAAVLRRGALLHA